MKNKFFTQCNYHCLKINFFNSLFRGTHLKYILFIFLLTTNLPALFAQDDTDYEVVDVEDELKKVCWPQIPTALTQATTNKMKTDTTVIPAPMAFGLASARILYNAVLVPNAFPNPDTAEVFDLLGNDLMINGVLIKFSPSTIAEVAANNQLGPPPPNFHWVGYQSNPFQPDRQAVYFYNIFHRWYTGMPCNYEGYGGRQYNGDNTAFANFSDTIFQPHPVLVSLIQPISCFGANDGILKANTNPLNFYTFIIDGSLTTLNNTFTQLSAGTHTITIIDSFFNSCDTIITLTQPSSTGSTTSISNCGTYFWPVSGLTYPSSGIYIFNTTLGTSCIQHDTLQLSVSPSVTNSTTITAYNFYTWPVNGLTYTSSGTYFNTATTTPGCQTNSILNLNIINIPFNFNLVIGQSISCFGSNDGSIQASITPPSSNAMYSINGGPFNNSSGFFQGLSAGTYTICVSNGIAAPVCKTITLLQPPPISVNIITDSLVSCFGNDGGLTANVLGGTPIYSVYWTNATNIILNTSYSISGIPPGLYKFFVQDENGCIKMTPKILTATPPLVVSATASPIKCNGSTTTIVPSSTGGTPPISYSIFGSPLIASYPAGTYTITTTDARGCSATTSIELVQAPLLSSNQTATACNSYYWSMNGTTYTQTGYYVAVLTTLSGCTIVNLLDLTINNNTISTSNITACNTYTWAQNGMTYTNSGTYTATSLNPSGCLHTSTLNLVINTNTTVISNKDNCDTYTWNIPGTFSTTYTLSGTYTRTSTNAAGCLQTNILNLIINNSTSSSQTITACNSYTWNLPGATSSTYTLSGIYTKTTTNAAGCVQTNILNLTINNSTSSSSTITACDSYTWNLSGATSSTYTLSGTYTKTTINAAGCVQTNILNLTINNSTSSSSTITACDSYTWNLSGATSSTYTLSGTYTKTTTNAAGCVQTNILNLTINNSTASTYSVTACNTYTWNVPGANASTYTISGIYTKTVLNGSGCIHTLTLNLTIKYTTFSTANITANNSFTWLANSITYTNSGSYTASLVNSDGCDSILTLNLTINQIPSVLTIRCFIQGYMDSPNSMTDVLANQSQPSSPSACDTIRVELHNPNFPYNTLYFTKVVLAKNGFATSTFPPLANNYYIVVKHRNALETWSATPIFIGGNQVNYNFTNAASKAFGANQIQVGLSTWAFYSSDIDHDENIDLLDFGLVENGASNFSFGYLPEDINGDGSVDLLDIGILELNLDDFISSEHPN